MTSLRRTGRERAAAWLVTGPVGHLAGGLADWASLVARWQWRRLTGRVRAARRLSGR
jgi:hypothetical protein